MILISHRGNINGRNPKLENNPKYIWEALHAGYQVEIDVWYDKGWWLGHNEPTYKCVRNDLLHCWCHAKNAEALRRLTERTIYHCFWHEDDYLTLTSRGYILIHVNEPVIKGGICIMPEAYTTPIKPSALKQCAGICSDQIEKYKYYLSC